jgi:hypothetical protein
MSHTLHYSPGETSLCWSCFINWAPIKSHGYNNTFIYLQIFSRGEPHSIGPIFFLFGGCDPTAAGGPSGCIGQSDSAGIASGCCSCSPWNIPRWYTNKCQTNYEWAGERPWGIRKLWLVRSVRCQFLTTKLIPHAIVNSSENKWPHWYSWPQKSTEYK